MKKNKTYNVLFIGNSYTYFNDMPAAIFKEIAESAGYSVRVSSIVKGGWTLEKHADPADECGGKVEQALNGEKYDFVVLQEQSCNPATDTDSFYSACRLLAKKIKKNGAQILLYSTWGRKKGSSVLEKYGFTTESMTYKLAAAYESIGEELGIARAYVGLAFFDVTSNTDIDLYDRDLTHPSYSGSYLAAMTLFSRMFEEDAESILFDGELPRGEAEILKKAAKRASEGGYHIPDEYNSSSEGVGKKTIVLDNKSI